MLILTLRTLVVYLALILAMRLMGKRQLGELQPSELVSTILLSNLASISLYLCVFTSCLLIKTFGVLETILTNYLQPPYF